MIEATIQMLRARHEEQVATVGVVCALFCDDLDEGIRRLENARDAAREFERSCDGRREKRKQRTALMIASVAEELIPGVRQVQAAEAKAE